jgi:ArsR family transcriptional regulator
LAELVPSEDVQFTLDRDRLSGIKQSRASAAAEYFQANADRWAEVRSLHVPEGEVERALLELAGDRVIDHLLDLGTGTGRMLEIFASRIGHGLGIDLSHGMLVVARARLAERGLRNCQVRHGDICNLALPNASFDLVLLHQVLCYAEAPHAVLLEAARLLRLDGRLIVADFAAHELDYLRRQHRHRWLGFPELKMERWLAAAGLRPAVTRHLAGDLLTLSIWLAEPAGRAPLLRPLATERELT